MANEGRLGREAVVVAVSNDTANSAGRLARHAVTVGHHFPEDLTAGRLARIGVVVAISRPHGWDVFDDPPL